MCIYNFDTPLSGIKRNCTHWALISLACAEVENKAGNILNYFVFTQEIHVLNLKHFDLTDSEIKGSLNKRSLYVYLCRRRKTTCAYKTNKASFNSRQHYLLSQTHLLLVQFGGRGKRGSLWNRHLCQWALKRVVKQVQVGTSLPLTLPSTSPTPCCYGRERRNKTE